jgi:acyl carrier protein
MPTTPSLDLDPGTTILTAAASVRGHGPGDLARERSLDTLGFDSLDRVVLAVTIEHTTGRTIPDQVMASARSFGDLIDQLTTATEGT